MIRHDDAVLPSALVVVHAAAALVLTGLIWVVQLVVYPAFAEVGRDQWPAYHRAHSRRIAVAVGPPWAVQALSAVGLLITRPPAVPLALVLGALVCLAGTVAATLLLAVPLHGRLARDADPDAVARLVRRNWLRVAAWTGAAGCGLAMVVRLV